MSPSVFFLKNQWILNITRYRLVVKETSTVSLILNQYWYRSTPLWYRWYMMVSYYGHLLFFHQLLWCLGVTPNLPQDNKKAPNTPISVISCQVFVALDGWAGIRLPPKTGLLEKTAVAVVPPHSEFTITAASPMFAMHLGQVLLNWKFA